MVEGVRRDRDIQEEEVRFHIVLWPPNKVRVLTGKGLTSSSSFWDQRLEPARQTTQLFEVTRWRHRFTMAFTLAGSASIPLSLTMKAKSLLEDSPTRGFYLFLLNWFRRSKVGSKSRKIMPRKSKSHRLSFILPVYKKEGNEQWVPGRAAL